MHVYRPNVAKRGLISTTCKSITSTPNPKECMGHLRRMGEEYTTQEIEGLDMTSIKSVIISLCIFYLYIYIYI